MTPIDSLSRRFVLLMAGAALAFSACGSDDTPTITSGSDGKFTVADDYILGDANAPVTLVEY